MIAVHSPNKEVRETALCLIEHIGELNPYTRQPATVESVRAVIRRYFGDAAANALRIEITLH